jgi:site-specific DNA recombinase
MITEQEYERVQVLLGSKGKSQPQKKEFAYTGLVRCEECDSAITAEEKKQVICSECGCKFSYLNRSTCSRCGIEIEQMKNPKILNYTYYRCAKKKGPCSQKYLRLEDFEKQFSDLLSKLTIDQEYIDVALDYLRDTQNIEISDYKKITQSLRKSYDQCVGRIERLNKEYTSQQNADYSIYSQDEFKQYKQELREERERIKKEIAKSELRSDESFDMAERTFNFCALAKKRFDEGDIKMKRTLLNSIGSNMTLKDKILSIELLYPFQLIINELQSQKSLNTKFEHEKAPEIQGLPHNLRSSDSKVSSMLRRQDSNLRQID